MFSTSPMGSGFYILDFNPPQNLSLSLTTTGIGDVQLDIGAAPPGSPVFTLVSFQTAQPLGAGPMLGVGADALLLVQVPTPPFQFFADAQGNSSFSLPGGLPPGLTIDVRGLNLVGGVYTTPIGRITF